MKDNFVICIESLHVGDRGEQNNVRFDIFSRMSCELTLVLLKSVLSRTAFSSIRGYVLDCRIDRTEHLYRYVTVTGWTPTVYSWYYIVHTETKHLYQRIAFQRLITKKWSVVFIWWARVAQFCSNFVQSMHVKCNLIEKISFLKNNFNYFD